MIERQLREGEFAARVSADHFVILLREPDEASTKERLNEFRLTSESVGEQVLVSMDFALTYWTTMRSSKSSRS